MDPRTGRVDRPGVDRASAVLGPAGTPSRLVGGGSSRSAPSPNSDGDLDRSQGKASSPDCCLDGLPGESSSGDPRLRAGTWRTAETVSGCVSAGRRGRRAAIRPHQRFNEPFGRQPVDVGTGVGAGTIGGATGLHPRGPPLPQGARRRLVDGQSLTGPERRVSARRSRHSQRAAPGPRTTVRPPHCSLAPAPGTFTERSGPPVRDGFPLHQTAPERVLRSQRPLRSQRRRAATGHTRAATTSTQGDPP